MLKILLKMSHSTEKEKLILLILDESNLHTLAYSEISNPISIIIKFSNKTKFTKLIKST
jgi:hypothetical protein